MGSRSSRWSTVQFGPISTKPIQRLQMVFKKCDILDIRQWLSIKGWLKTLLTLIKSSPSKFSVHYYLMEGEKRELQLLFNVAISTDDPTGAYKPLLMTTDQIDQPQLDLSLSMSIISPQLTASNGADSNSKSVQVLKHHAAEQVRLAALERAYAERMRELARRELEQAEKEFARARMIWKRAQEEVEKVESMKMIATRRISSTCIQITCQNCRQHFQP